MMRMFNTFKPQTVLQCLFVVTTIFMLGCAAKPEINMRDELDFSAIHTFYIQPPLNPLNQTMENHIASVITSVLQQKGLQPASQEDADMEISFFPNIENKDEGTTLSIGLGTGTYGRSGGISIGGIFSIPVGEQVSQYQNLQIDMKQKGTVIYSAVGSAKLEAADRITAQEALTTLVSELLAPYPQRQ